MRQKFSTPMRLVAAAAAALVLCATAAAADAPVLQDGVPDRYEVQKGDTLWGIAGKFLKDPWRWPEVWRMNRDDIRNPHRIYPGDVIVLDRSSGEPRLALERPTERASPRVRASPLDAQAIPSIPPGDIEAYLSRPLITDLDALANAPRIIAGKDGRVLRGENDSVYVTGLTEANGVLWYIYRQGRRFYAADSGDFLGEEQRFLGIARVERFGEVSTVKIHDAKEEIIVGDRLVPAPPEVLVNFVPHAPTAKINGRLVATSRDSIEVGRGWIVTLDKGSADGLDVGAVLAIYRSVAPMRDPRPSNEPEQVFRLLDQTRFFQRDKYVQIPDERTGLVFVFRVFDRVSYALVLNTTDPVHVGDFVRNP